MNSDLLTRWTAIITNIAIVVGLVFVGLEFRNNSKSIEAERVDNITQAIIASNTLLLQTEGLSDLLFEAYASPEELTPKDRDKLTSYMYVSYSQFLQVHQAYLAGLVSEEQWQFQKAAIGFAFSSEPGVAYINIMRASAMNSDTLDVVHQSAINAHEYCKNPNNVCTDRYEAPFSRVEAR